MHEQAAGNQTHAWILTREWHDTDQGIELEFWCCSDIGPLHVIVSGEQAVCFVERSSAAVEGPVQRKQVQLKNLYQEPVDALYFNKQYDLKTFKKNADFPIYESDIKPTDRYLMERFINGSISVDGTFLSRGQFQDCRSAKIKPAFFEPALSILSFDIETNIHTDMILSIAGVFYNRTNTESRVFMISDHSIPMKNDAVCISCSNEKALLEDFFSWLKVIDPDVLIGWNVINFDLQHIFKRCQTLGIRFSMGRGTRNATILPPVGSGQNYTARLPGRVVLDGIETLRAAFWQFESFALDSVATELLGKGKLIDEESDRTEGIIQRFNNNKPALADYNLQDCELVREIFDHTDLIGFSLERARVTGLSFGRNGGSVAAFDFLYLPRLHREGYVAYDPHSDAEGGLTSPGGYVMDSAPGLYKNVLVLDFKSLYPSIIRTFLIDPLGLHLPSDNPVAGFDGANFNRTHNILPDLIKLLWDKRDLAKSEKNAPMSQAVKIIMNSFYGVLGSSACRFYNPQLTSSITKRGHAIIIKTRELIETFGHSVIYGDTDSVFVLLEDTTDSQQARLIGKDLETRLNQWWHEYIRNEYKLTSHLELEFETHYERFLMPTVRGSQSGSKKRYAGSIRQSDNSLKMIFKGLETVRSDWTPLARSFQRELFERIFTDLPYKDFIRHTVSRMNKGELDDQLRYRKRIRQSLELYQKNVPPHIQAARQLPEVGKWIEYYITSNGPQAKSLLSSTLDYGHYQEKQLKPVADTLLQFLGTNFDDIVSGQQDFFP